MKLLDEQTKKDIINWDISNWSKALDYWEKNIPLEDKKYKCLELGASCGGLSLWLALNRNKVICSDVQGPHKDARRLHEKYTCGDNIEYAAIDATAIPYENHFDLIVFKSILGGISSNNQDVYKKKTLDEIYKALKPGGILLFAENLQGSFLHTALRKKFGTKNWNYLRLNEIDKIFSEYRSIEYTTVGFLGCLGRTENQRTVLGKIDTVLDKLLPGKYKYIAIGIAVK
ncbi:class I SAM-dependent methyltransferase [Pedobacter sp. P351]|uniref:class I SAM-dependent methyltransferase n=1 Tax=Pedobacter superstes TaxID=3133441 RepID=UPI0030B31E8D